MMTRDPLHPEDLPLFDVLWQRVMGPAMTCHCLQRDARCGCGWRCVDDQRPIVGLLTAWQTEAARAGAAPAQRARLLSAFLGAQLWLSGEAEHLAGDHGLLWHHEPGQRRLLAVQRERLLRTVAPQAVAGQSRSAPLADGVVAPHRVCGAAV
jgi:hypothetical protein